jgi:hypothetical protein
VSFSKEEINMKYATSIIFTALLCAVAADQALAGSVKDRVTKRISQTYPWHGAYYDAAWGVPVALVVPPTAENQAKMGWGVGNTRSVPIEHQFGRDYPGPGSLSRLWFKPTPRWPSDTDQFGDYYIRGPR